MEALEDWLAAGLEFDDSGEEVDDVEAAAAAKGLELAGVVAAPAAELPGGAAVGVGGSADPLGGGGGAELGGGPAPAGTLARAAGFLGGPLKAIARPITTTTASNPAPPRIKPISFQSLDAPPLAGAGAFCGCGAGYAPRKGAEAGAGIAGAGIGAGCICGCGMTSGLPHAGQATCVPNR